MATAAKQPAKKPPAKPPVKVASTPPAPSAPSVPTAQEIARARHAMQDAHVAVVTAQNVLRRARSLAAVGSDLPHSVEEAEEGLAEARRAALDAAQVYQGLLKEAGR